MRVVGYEEGECDANRTVLIPHRANAVPDNEVTGNYNLSCLEASVWQTDTIS